MLAIAVRCQTRDEFGPFPNDSYSLRSVRHKAVTTVPGEGLNLAFACIQSDDTDRLI